MAAAAASSLPQPSPNVEVLLPPAPSGASLSVSSLSPDADSPSGVDISISGAVPSSGADPSRSSSSSPPPFTPAFSDFYPHFPSSSSSTEKAKAREEEEEWFSASDEEDSPSVSPSPVCSAASRKFLGGEKRKGRKYFLAGRVNGSLFHQVLDSAADLSIIPRRIVSSLGLEEIPLASSFQVNGFQGQDSPEIRISSKCRVVADLGGASLPVEYFVAPIDVDYALLGTDVIGDPSSGLRFESSSGIVEMDKHLFITKKIKVEATIEMRRRMKMSPAAFLREYKSAGYPSLMRSNRRQILRPNSVSWVSASVSGRGVSACHAFLSHLDDGQHPVTAPSLTFHRRHHCYSIPVINETSESIILPAGKVLGDVVQLSKDPSASDSSPSVFHLVSGKDLLVEEGEQQQQGQQKQQQQQHQQQHQQQQQQQQQHPPQLPKSIDLQNFKQSTSQSTNQSTNQPSSQPTDQPVLLSQIADVDKIDSSTLTRAHTNGIDADVSPKKRVIDEGEFLRLDVNIEEERKKGASSTMWDDMTEEEYLKQFKRNEMVTDEHYEKWKKLLLDFRHCFYNKKKPHLFTGLNMNPVEIHALPGTVPKKDRLRRQSDVKAPYILEHLEQLKAEGVIKEATDLTSGFLSNVVLVLESRYVASVGREVKKSRFTLDYRICNQYMLDTHWHLPNMCDFRRRIASGGYTVFTNLDATSFYYQHKVSERTSKLFSGFWAANKLWVMSRLAMGWKVSGSYAQFWMDMAFKFHHHCSPFMDDLSLYSMSIDEMLDQDLPHCLAICSVYNLLLSPAKAEICTDSLRVLGFELSEGAHGISPEKVEKIRNLKFPETKSELISSLAFFSWFLTCNPKLSDALGPLRDAAKSNVRYAPNQDHRDAFELAKKRLLDPALGRIRSPSTRLEDDLFVATDSSHHALGVVILQKLPPTLAEVAAGVPADSKQLYIVQVFSKTLPPEKRPLPIWWKEFFALDLAVDKFDFLLRARPFTVVVDNRVLRFWANLERIDDAMTRRVLKLQSYDFHILFVETRMQPADSISRWEEDDHRDGVYHQRFLQGRIKNGYGQEVPIESLFCDDTKQELFNFFQNKKRTTLSDLSDNLKCRPKPTDPTPEVKHLKHSEDSPSVHEIHADSSVDGPDGLLHAELDASSASILPRRRIPCLRRKIHRRRRATRRWKRKHDDGEDVVDVPPTTDCSVCSDCIPLGGSADDDSDGDVEAHCSCLCARNLRIAPPSVSLVQLNDGDVANGRVQGGDDVTDDVLSSLTHPVFSDETLAAVKKMQEDSTVQEMISYVSGVADRPGKQESMLLPPALRALFRHFRLFHVTEQGVLLRQWTSSGGEVRWLLVISDEELQRLIRKVHEFTPSLLQPAAGGRKKKEVGERESRAVHSGINRTLSTIGAHYYHHSLRQIVSDYIRKCPFCVLLNHPRGKKDSPGLQTPMSPGISLAIDFCGPWNTQTDFKYLFCGLDLF